jgi:hypothetical protein
VPPGSEEVVICGGLSVRTRIDNACVSLCPKVSATRTVNGKVPVAVGDPVIVPDVGLMVRPGGSDPAEMLQVSGPVPVASTAWL